MKELTGREFIKLFPSCQNRFNNHFKVMLDVSFPAFIVNNGYITYLMPVNSGYPNIGEELGEREKKILETEFGFEEIVLGKNISIYIQFTKKFTKEKFFKSIKCKADIYQNEINNFIFSFRYAPNSNSYYNYLFRFELDIYNKRFYSNFYIGREHYNDKLIRLFLEDITEEHFVKAREEGYKAALEKINEFKNKIQNSEPVFLVFDASKNLFKYIGYNDPKKGIMRYAKYGSSDDRLTIIRKAMNLFNDEENTLQIKCGWQYQPEVYVFKKEILFTSTEFRKELVAGSSRIIIKISDSLPVIPLSEEDLEKVEEFGLKYFEDPDDYYAWALQAQLAE